MFFCWYLFLRILNKLANSFNSFRSQNGTLMKMERIRIWVSPTAWPCRTDQFDSEEYFIVCMAMLLSGKRFFSKFTVILLCTHEEINRRIRGHFEVKQRQWVSWFTADILEDVASNDRLLPMLFCKCIESSDLLITSARLNRRQRAFKMMPLNLNRIDILTQSDQCCFITNGSNLRSGIVPR